MRAIKLPVSFSSGGMDSTSDIHRIIRQKIIDVLVTNTRERWMRPGYGAGVYRFLYEMLDPLVFADFKVDALQELNANISGVSIVDIVMLAEDNLGYGDGNTTLSITVRYKVPPAQLTSMTFSVSEFVTAETPV